jgi:hypothetical protein
MCIRSAVSSRRSLCHPGNQIMLMCPEALQCPECNPAWAYDDVPDKRQLTYDELLELDPNVSCTPAERIYDLYTVDNSQLAADAWDEPVSDSQLAAIDLSAV